MAFKQFLYPPPFLLFTSVANIKYADLQDSILMYEKLISYSTGGCYSKEDHEYVLYQH